jgi:ribosomal protein L40E
MVNIIRYFWQGVHQLYGHIRCILYGIFGRNIAKYTVIYGEFVRFWPTLDILLIHLSKQSVTAPCTPLHTHTHTHRHTHPLPLHAFRRALTKRKSSCRRCVALSPKRATHGFALRTKIKPAALYHKHAHTTHTALLPCAQIKPCALLR